MAKGQSKSNLNCCLESIIAMRLLACICLPHNFLKYIVNILQMDRNEASELSSMSKLLQVQNIYKVPPKTKY